MHNNQPSYSITIKRKGNNYIVFIRGQVFLVQPIIASSYIPAHMTPSMY